MFKREVDKVIEMLNAEDPEMVQLGLTICADSPFSDKAKKTLFVKLNSMKFQENINANETIWNLYAEALSKTFVATPL